MKRTDIPQDKIRSILVEVDLTGAPASGTFSANLGSVAQLRDAVGIISIEAFNTTLQTTSPTRKTNLPDAAYKCSYLTIADSANTEIRQKIPVSKLIRSNSSSPVQPINLFGVNGSKPMDPQRSIFEISDTTTMGSGTVALFEVVYVVA